MNIEKTQEELSAPAAPLLQPQADVLDAVSVLRSIIEDGYLSDSNTGVGHSVLDAVDARHVAALPQSQGEADKRATTQGMVDCMDMVRQELIEAGIIDKTVAPMFIANAVMAYIQKLTPAQQGEGSIDSISDDVGFAEVLGEYTGQAVKSNALSASMPLTRYIDAWHSACLADMEARKDAAYLERNQVVATLAKCFPSGLARTAIEGWSEDWHGCIYIDLPTGQVSWHYHDSHAYLFAGFPHYLSAWDGHTTEEKYKRLARLARTAAPSEDMDATYMLKREIHNLKRHIEDYCKPAALEGQTIPTDLSKRLRAQVNTSEMHLIAMDRKDVLDAADEIDRYYAVDMELALYRDCYGPKVPTEATVDVLAERQRQKEVEGWTPEHDDEHNNGQLAVAAACYAVENSQRLAAKPPLSWPWDAHWWKPKGNRRNLIKAGALILAEIERLDRADLAKTGGAA